MYYNLVWLRPGSYLNYNISPPNYQKLIMCYTLVVTPPLLGCVGCVGYSICNMFPLITCMHPSCMYPILAQACVRMCLCLFLSQWLYHLEPQWLYHLAFERWWRMQAFLKLFPTPIYVPASSLRMCGTRNRKQSKGSLVLAALNYLQSPFGANALRFVMEWWVPLRNTGFLLVTCKLLLRSALQWLLLWHRWQGQHPLLK